MTHRDNTDHIIVEDGKIFIEILPNNSVDSRSGIVYLTTIIPNGSSVMVVLCNVSRLILLNWAYKTVNVR